MKRTENMVSKCGIARSERMKWVNIIVFILFIAFMWAYFSFVPPYYDDLNFLNNSYPDQNPALSGGLPDRILRMKNYILTTQNCRLGNLFSGFLLFLPRCLSSGLITLSFIISVLAVYRLAGVRWKSRGICWGIGLWILCLPWYDDFTTIVFQGNYMPVMAISLLLLLYLHDARETGLEKVFAFLTGGLIGALHEGFGIPMLGGLGVVYLFFKRERRRVVLWTMLGLLLSLCAATFTPVTLNRVEKEVFSSINSESVKYFIRGSFGLFVFALGIISCILKRGMKSLLHDSFSVFLIASGFLSVCVCVVTNMQPRAFWWGDVCGIIFVLRLWAEGEKASHKSLNLRVFMGWSAFAVALLIMGCTWVGLYRVKKGVDAGLEAKHRNPNETVFIDMFTNEALPVPSQWMLDTSDPYWALTREYRLHGSRWVLYETPVMMLPRQLEYVTSGSGKPLDGGSGIRITDGVLFCEAATSGAKEEFNMADVRFGNTLKNNIGIIRYPFISKKDGRSYYYISLNYSGLIYSLCPVTALFPIY